MIEYLLSILGVSIDGDIEVIEPSYNDLRELVIFIISDVKFFSRIPLFLEIIRLSLQFGIAFSHF